VSGHPSLASPRRKARARNILDANTDVLRMAYIDSKMAEMRSAGQVQPQFGSQDSSTLEGDDVHALNTKGPQRNPAGLGKLQEIDLGPDTMLRNIARTEAAQRRLETGESDTAGDVKLGRDGKPWRGKKRRNSEDIRRDQLVEQVLRESRCKSGGGARLPYFAVHSLIMTSGHLRGA
jgi:hypothetical protein